MIITKDQQERLVTAYVKEGRTTEEIISFSKGMERAFELVDKILKK